MRKIDREVLLLNTKVAYFQDVDRLFSSIVSSSAWVILVGMWRDLI